MRLNSPLLRGFGWLSTLQGGTAALMTLVSVYAARELGPQLFGKVTFAYSVLLYALPIAAFGTHLWGTREVAAGRLDPRTLVLHLLGLRTALAAVVYMGVTVFAAGAVADAGTRWLVLGFAVAVFPVAWVADWALQGQERMHHVAGARAVRQGGYAIGILVVVHAGLGVGWFALSYALAATAASAYSLTTLGWLPHRMTDLIDARGWRRALAGSWEVGVAAIAAMGLYRLDSVLVGVFHGERAVGVYGAAGNVTLGLLLGTAAFRDVLLPRVTIHWRRARESLPGFLRTVMQGSVAAAALAAVSISVGAREIVLLLYGERYAEAGAILHVSVWIFPFVVTSAILSVVLMVTGRTRRYLQVLVAQAVTHALVIFALIPGYGSLAAAATIVGVEALGACAFVWCAWDVVRGFALRTGALIAAAGGAGLALSFIPHLGSAPLAIRLPVAAGLYVSAVVATRTIRWADLRGGGERLSE